MFNASTVISEFLPLIGLRKDPNPAATLNPMGDLLTASTGQYYNDQHPLLTPKNLAAIAEAFSGYTYSAWSNATTYAAGDIVTSGGNYYVSLVNGNLNHAVGALTAYWRQTTPYNEQLRIKICGAIVETLNTWIGRKFKRGTAANLLKRSQVINPPGTKSESVGDTDRYVSWSVVPSPLLDHIITIDRVGIQMSDSESTTIEIYKNGASMPLTSVVIAGDGTSDWIWAELGLQLERGNFYYVSVDRNDIAAIPINALAGMNLSGSTFNRFPGTLPYAEVGAFEHAGPGTDGWTDVNDILTNTNNYGLNLQLSAECDYTNLIVDQSALFIPAILKGVALALLSELLYNPHAVINREQGNSRGTLMYDINGNPEARNIGGLKKAYEQAIDNITFDTRHLSKDCLPCIANNISIGSV